MRDDVTTRLPGRAPSATSVATQRIRRHHGPETGAAVPDGHVPGPGIVLSSPIAADPATQATTAAPRPPEPPQAPRPPDPQPRPPGAARTPAPGRGPTTRSTPGSPPTVALRSRPHSPPTVAPRSRPASPPAPARRPARRAPSSPLVSPARRPPAAAPRGRRTRLVARAAGATVLVLAAVAGLGWTVLVAPDRASETPAVVRSAPVPPGPPPVNWVRTGGDEFDRARVDGRRWSTYDSAGAFGNGLRRPSAVAQAGGLLTITARPRLAGGTSGGIAMHRGQLYGRWEFRARTDTGRGYSPAILLWPDSERFPDDGELDMMEIPYGDRHATTAFVHWGKDNHVLSTETPGDFTQWHTFTMDWLPDRITSYVDGVKRWEVTDRRAIPRKPMHLAVQLDQGPAPKWIPGPDATTPEQVRLQVDWARVYRAG